MWGVASASIIAMLLISCATTESVSTDATDTASMLKSGQAVGTVYFTAESAALSERSLGIIKEAAREIKATSEEGARVVIAVGGHTALAGTAEGRAALSQRRAEVVAAQLREQGISSANMVVDSFGAEQPAADNTTAEGRARNRRTVISVQSIADQ